MEWQPGWQMVECKRCHRKYQCTPENDYYNSTNATDGVCEKCLLDEAGVAGPVITIDFDVKKAN